MSASSKPTRKPRSRRPNARLSAVVDFPTPPLPEATAMTAAMPGISDCFDIGDAGPCGGRCDETCGTPCACRCGGGAAAEPGLRSAVKAIIATLTPGIARTAASACARTLSHARASAASTLIEKNTLPSVTDIADNTSALVKATPRGDITLARPSRTCCCVTLTAHLLAIFGCDPWSGGPAQRLPAPNIIPALGGRRFAALLGGLVVQFDHDSIGVIDEDLPKIAARNLSRVEFHPFGLQPLLHSVKTLAGEGDVMDDAGVRGLRLVGPGNIDQMHHRLALAVHPCPGEGKVRPGALLQAEDILVEPDRVGELAGPDIEMVEHAYADAHAMLLPFS